MNIINLIFTILVVTYYGLSLYKEKARLVSIDEKKQLKIFINSFLRNLIVTFFCFYLLRSDLITPIILLAFILLGLLTLVIF